MIIDTGQDAIITTGMVGIVIMGEDITVMVVMEEVAMAMHVIMGVVMEVDLLKAVGADVKFFA
jgi:hypothetical protein